MDYPQLLERLEALARLGRWGDETTARREPADEVSLSQAEQRLGVALPDSYKRFLRCTNGYGGFGLPPQDLRSVERIDWFRTEEQEWIETWDDHGIRVPDEIYLDYGNDQNQIFIRTEYLRSTLQISDVFDGAVYLLNPEIKTPAGEWEAWFLANWLPGALRYPSFYELVLEQVFDGETSDWRNDV